MPVQLLEVTPEVLTQLRAAVVLPPEQATWVGGTVDDNLQEASDHPEGNPWPRAVYLDGTPVGFMMLSWNVVPQLPHIVGPWFLWKLMIAPAFQSQGIGREVVRMAASIVKEQGATQLLTSVAKGPGSPFDFYVGLGFVPTGENAENEEEVLALALT
ncbi:MAG: GNAT family N-acetyltransferase [Nocardiopsaceae bacterium]|nr:GNAT family N-acetyltransferase [Nocardiopsaceae bacterium]